MALTIVQASVAKSSTGSSSSGIAGSTITAGQTLYVDTANNNVLKPAVAAGTAISSAVVGIAEHGALAGQPIRYCTSDTAFTIGCTGTIGDTVWAYGTGQMTITQSEGIATSTYTTVIGTYVSTTQVKLNITAAGAVR
jgi:hypothetical protein